MNKSKKLFVPALWASLIASLFLSGSNAQKAKKTAQKPPQSPPRIIVPKIWDAQQLATWATPIAGINAIPTYLTEEEYYAAPADNLRTYPVYPPDYEPKAYQQWLKQQRRIPARLSDAALYALGKYIYSLQPPANPHKPDALSAQGKRVFAREGCATCHTPPLYTNNMLMPVEGFTPPKADPRLARLQILRGIRLGTDPNLALKTRKGTGFYKVPSLKGLWYRGLLEHSGSIASLEDWFDKKRLQDDYQPNGW